MSLTLASALLLGSLLGFALQRGRFCFAGGFRSLYMFNDGQMVIAMLIVITLQSIGLFAFYELGWAKIPGGAFPWLATIVGGVLFGLGMGFAGTCSTGACYRAAEGMVGSIVAVLGFIVASYLYKPYLASTFKPLADVKLANGSIDKTLGISPWLCVAVLTIITVALVFLHLKKDRVAIPQPTPRKTGLAHVLFEARWHPFITALLIGVIALLAWPSSLADGRVGGLGITGPSSQLGAFIFEGKTGFFERWPGFLLMGILLGALIAALGSREFRLRSPGIPVIVKSGIGGLLMGVGSSLAGGCMLGNALVGTAYFSWQGWLFIPCILAGSWLVNYFSIIRPMNLSKVTA